VTVCVLKDGLRSVAGAGPIKSYSPELMVSEVPFARLPPSGYPATLQESNMAVGNPRKKGIKKSKNI